MRKSLAGDAVVAKHETSERTESSHVLQPLVPKR